jgi:hypothetical protein
MPFSPASWSTWVAHGHPRPTWQRCREVRQLHREKVRRLWVLWDERKNHRGWFRRKMRVSHPYKKWVVLAKDGSALTNANKGLKPGQVEGVEGLFVCNIVLRRQSTASNVQIMNQGKQHKHFNLGHENIRRC